MSRLAMLCFLVASHQSSCNAAELANSTEVANSTEPCFGSYPEDDSSLKFVDASGPTEILRWLLYRTCFSDPDFQPKFMQSPQKMLEFFERFSESNAEKLLSATWALLDMKQKQHDSFRVCNLNPQKLQEGYVEGVPESEPQAKCIQYVKMTVEQETKLRDLFECS